MKRSVMLWVLLLTVMVMSFLAGCGGPDNTSDALDSGFATGINYTYVNTPPDYYGAVSLTCNMWVTYNSALQAPQIDTVTITDQSGTTWSLPGTNLSNPTAGVVGFVLPYTENIHAFPLAGTWTAEIKLKDGRFSTVRERFSEPGTLNAPVHAFVYTAEDWTPSANQSEYVPILGRFPTGAVTFANSSSASGRAITTSGFAAANAAYVAAQPTAYNLYCGLYDASRKEVGVSMAEYATDHSATTLVGSDGEIKITAATMSPATLDLSTVKYVRIFCRDGAQWQSLSPGTYQAVSISSMVTVH